MEMRRIMLTRRGGPRIPFRRATSLSELPRILIVRLSHLGDVVCSIGILHALHATYPGARIAWAVQPEFAGVLEGLPGLERVIPFERRGGARAWLTLRRALRAFDPDWAIDAQGNWKSASAAFLSGAPRRTGFARADWSEGSARLLLNDAAPPTATGREHLLDRIEALAAHVAPPRAVRAPRTDLAPTAAEIEGGRARLARMTGTPERAVALHLSSRGDVRGWPVERWVALATELVARGRTPLILAGPAESEVLGDFEDALASSRAAATWGGEKRLRELVGFFAAAGERGVPLVSCDSGPMHVAWASGMRVVALEGPRSAARTGPWPRTGAGHVELRAPNGPGCAPCFSHTCTHASGPICMADIPIDAVMRAID